MLKGTEYHPLNEFNRRIVRQTGSQADRQTVRQTDSQADRQTDRQTNKPTDRHSFGRSPVRQSAKQTDRQISFNVFRVVVLSCVNLKSGFTYCCLCSKGVAVSKRLKSSKWPSSTFGISKASFLRGIRVSLNG